MCISPITLVKARDTWNVCPTDIVPCGRCPECLQSKVNSWAFRIEQELKRSESAVFSTLTYLEPPKTFNGLDTLDKSDYQKFMKRLRKKCQKDVQLKYYTCGEYGSKYQRPHYHALLFNLPKKYTLDSRYIEDVWQNGLVHNGLVEPASIYYTLKYMQKGNFLKNPEDLDWDDREEEFSLKSKGLGENFLTPQQVNYIKENKMLTVTKEGGVKMSMPRYYRDKIWTKGEQRTLAEETRPEREELIQKTLQKP